MSRTYRKHLAPGAAAKRGGKNVEAPDMRKRPFKSHKQRRPNKRVALRREHL